jgi:predicted nucleic acid-binding protein
MMLIDSQIWIYYLDPAAIEHRNIDKWLNDILTTEQFALSAIIPLEIAHKIYRIPKIDINIAEKTLNSLISLQNCQILEIDQFGMFRALEILQQKRNLGIGGRDALILASMESFQISRMVTHDKKFLMLEELERIDPVFDPPLILKIGEKFDPPAF